MTLTGHPTALGINNQSTPENDVASVSHNADAPGGASIGTCPPGVSPSPLANLRTALQGKKTHITCAVMLMMLFGSWQGWWKVPAEVMQGLNALALMFLRAG